MQQQLSLEGFVRHVPQHVAGSHADSNASSGTAGDVVATLQQQLSSIEGLAKEGAQAVSDAQVLPLGYPY